MGQPGEEKEDTRSPFTREMHSRRADKGHISREASIIEKRHATAHTLGQLEMDDTTEVFGRLKEKVDAIQEHFADMLIRYPDKERELEQAQQEVHTSFLSTMARYDETCRHFRANMERAAAAITQDSTPLGKVETKIEPKQLTLTFTPQQFEDWAEQYSVFYRANKMHKRDHLEQRYYLLRCLNDELASYVKGNLPERSDILGSVLPFLRERFRKQYPLAARRNKFFEASCPPGTKPMVYYYQLKGLMNQADLDRLSSEEILTSKFIASVPFPKLKQELIKLDKPTEADVCKTIDNLSLTDNMDKYCSSSNIATTAPEPSISADSAALKFEQRPRSRKPRDQRNPNDPCLSCNEKGHKRKDCKFLTARCDKCHRRGHIAKACMQGSKPESAREAEEAFQDNNESAQAGVEVVNLTRMSGGYNEGVSPTPRKKMYFGTVNGKIRYFTYRTLPDSGCTRTVFNSSILKKHGVSWEERDNLFCRVADDNLVKCQGYIDLRVKAEPQQQPILIKAIVCNKLTQEILMGWKDLIALGILPPDFPNVRYDTELAATAAATTSTAEPVRPEEDENLDFKTPEELKDHILRTFPTVIKESLDNGALNCEPMKIEFKKGITATPFRATTARAIPLHKEAKAKELIKMLVKKGVIEEVTENSEWVSPAFFVDKPNSDKIRLVTDFTKLNKFLQRPIHPFPSTRQVLEGIRSDSKYFAALDAVEGYHQMKIREKDRHLTTFLLPFGRYRYKRGPMGLAPTSDNWCRKSDEAIVGSDYTKKIVDDICVQAPSLQIMWRRLLPVLQNSRRLNLTLSKRKFNIGSSINFAGHIISDKGIEPKSDMLTAITDFPQPKNVSELRSFLGMAQQLASFMPDYAHNTVIMSGLLKKKNSYVWTEDHQAEFVRLKELLTSEPLVQPFDPNLKTELYTDASKLNGLGFALIQKEPTGRPRLIQCGSCLLSPAEKNYAVVELEALAAAYAMNKARFYLDGIDHFDLFVDHRPLVGLFEKPLADIDNSRLLRIRLKTTSFNFTVTWKPGKNHCIADALSRFPVFQPQTEVIDSQEVMREHAKAVSELEPCQSMLNEALVDDNYQTILSALRENSDVANLNEAHPAQELRTVWHNLSTVGGSEQLITLDGSRIFVPEKSRPSVISELHRSHAGLEKTLISAKALYYWPTMKADIQKHILACTACSETRPAKQKSFIAESSEPVGPMSDVGLDMFYHDKRDYLIMVCRYSGWPWVAEMKRTLAEDVIRVLQNWFLIWGRPLFIRSDGGPQFSNASFASFCSSNNITHQVSSAYNPQSNGLAEAGVKNMKLLIQRVARQGEDAAEALLAFRNTCRKDGSSPAQLMFGRRLRGTLPTLASHLRVASAETRQSSYADKVKVTDANRQQYNKRATRKATFLPGQKVIIQHPLTKKWTQKCIILGDAHRGQAYRVKNTDNNKIFIRNPRFIRLDNTIAPKSDTNATSAPVQVAPRRSARLQAGHVLSKYNRA